MRPAKLVPVAVVLLASYLGWREYAEGRLDVYGVGPAPPEPPAEAAPLPVWSPERIENAVGVYEADFLDPVITGYEYTFTFTVERSGEGIKLVAEAQGATPFRYAGSPPEEPIRFNGTVAGASLSFDVKFSWPRGETVLSGTYLLEREHGRRTLSRSWQARRVR